MKERTLKKGLQKWSLMALACIAALGSTAQAQTNGCVYFSRTNGPSGSGTSTQLYKVLNPGTSNATMVAIGSPVNFGYNGIGYYNGDLYGIAYPGNIIKINPTTGVVTNVGVSLPPGNYASGEVANGILYTSNMEGGGTHYMRRVNLATLTYTTVALLPQFADFVFYNGYLYGIGTNAAGGGQVCRVDPNTGAITQLAYVYAGYSGNAAVYGDGTGMIYFNRGGTYNVNTGVATQDTAVGTGEQPSLPLGTDIDATFCPTCVCSTAPTTTTLSGKLFSDPAGNHTGTTGTNGGGLYASLINNSGVVVATVPLNADGTYSFSNVAPGTYSVALTPNASGSTTPSLNPGWVITGEGYQVWDPVEDGKINNITVGSSPVTAVNFMVDQLPTAGSSTVTTGNPGGMGTIVLTNNFTGTDPDGTVAQIHFIGFPNNTTSITIGNNTYTSSNWPATGVTVPVGTAVLLDPVDGAVTPVVPYKVIDNGGKESLNTGNVTVNLTTPATYMVSGNVYDDANGSTIDGTGTNAGGTLYVVLTNASGTIVGSSPVAANGTYSISAPAGTYSAILTTSPTSTTPALPTGWANTNEGLTAAGDGTVNGTIPNINVSGNVNATNFGIDQLPTAGNSTVTTGNPGGTGAIVLTNNFTGTDPDGTVAQIHFIGFPNNTTSITIGNNTYTSSNWPATGVTVPVGTAVLLDPVDGAVTPVVPYKVIDNGGKESLNTGNVTVNITAPGGTPDLTPSLDIDNLSFPVAGVSRDFVVNVFEINGGTAVNPITVRLAKLSAFTITYSTESGTSNVYGGIANENSNWTFTENASFIIATAKPGVNISANGAAVLGFTIARKAGVINGTTQNLTTTITGGSGGEINTTNNKTLTSFTASPN